MPAKPWIIPDEELPRVLAEIRCKLDDPQTLPQHRATLARIERLLVADLDEVRGPDRA